MLNFLYIMLIGTPVYSEKFEPLNSVKWQVWSREYFSLYFELSKGQTNLRHDRMTLGVGKGGTYVGRISMLVLVGEARILMCS